MLNQLNKQSHSCPIQESHVVARKPRDAACFAYIEWLFDCYLLIYLHSLHKSRCEYENI